MKTLTFDTLSETEEIKAGETFIYVDGLNGRHKIRAREMVGLTGEQACKKCIFRNNLCGRVSCEMKDRESKDDVYYEVLTLTNCYFQ